MIKSTVEFDQAILVAQHTARVANLFWLFLCVGILATIGSAAWNWRGQLTRNVVGAAARIERFGSRATREADALQASRVERVFARRARRRFVAGMKGERFQRPHRRAL